MICFFLLSSKFYLKLTRIKMTQKKNISSKTKHKQLLRVSRVKKLEEKMKLNIKKRKKSS